MLNPFCPPGRTSELPGPLNPCLDTSHNDYYVNVDHIQESFDKYRSQLGKWNVVNDGGAVLIHGEDGCGKTSLAYRCAQVTKEYFDSGGFKSEVIDRIWHELEGVSVTRKCEDLVLAVLRHIRDAEEFIPKAHLAKIPVPPTNPSPNDLRLVLEEISLILTKLSRFLIVLAPKVELNEELSEYLSVFKRGRVVLIMETNQQGVSQNVVKSNRVQGKTKVLTLEVGALEVEQGWTFVQARLQHLESADKSDLPLFDETAVGDYMKKRSVHTRISVRELEIVCIHLYEQAVESGQKVIGYNDFSDLWIKRGGGIS